MNDASQISNRSTRSVPLSSEASDRPNTFVRYGVILGLLAGIRAFEMATSGAYLRTYLYDSRPAWILAPVIAAVICYFAASVLRKFYSPAITILMSVVIGATVTLIVSTILGMAAGLIAGALATFDVSRRVLKVLMLAMLWLGMPAAIFGGVSGYIGGMHLVRSTSPIDQARNASWVFAYLIALGIVWVYFLGRKERKQHGFRFSGFLTDVVAFLAFLTVAASAFVGGVQADNSRRTRVAKVANGGRAFVPLGYESFVRGFWEPDMIMLDNGLSEEQGKLLSPLGSFGLIWVGSSRWNGQGISEADYSGLRHLQLGNVSLLSSNAMIGGLTDEDLAPLAQSMMLSKVMLPISEITDEGLKCFGRASTLMMLDLRGSKVTGSGIAHLHPMAPLTWVYLSGSPVADEVFKQLSGPGRAIRQLTLSGTKITGDGLKGATLPSLEVLDVSNSRFDERNIQFIPPKINRLSLNGIKISAAGAELLSKLQPRHLSLTDTGVDDSALSKLVWGVACEELIIDASQLTTASAKLLAQPQQIELVFEADGRTLDEILQHVNAMRNAIHRELGWDGVTSRFSPGRELTFTVNELEVSRDMVPRLLKANVQLSNPMILPTQGGELLTVERNRHEEQLYELGASRGVVVDVEHVDWTYSLEERRSSSN